MIKTFPTLYKIDTKGKIRQWFIIANEGIAKLKGPFYTVSHGVKDGAMQTTTVQVPKGKNIGKANETTAWEQCLLETESLWKKQKERKGYRETIDQAKSKPKMAPMLAKSYNVPGNDLTILKDGKHIKFPCYGQPKLDGIRCLASIDNGCTVLYSRQFKVWTSLGHISSALSKLSIPGHVILDGELYIHGEEFQKIVSAIKRDKASDESLKIEYHIYDYISDKGYEDRYKDLQQWIVDNPLIKLVPIQTIPSARQVPLLHSVYTKASYEGMMLRNLQGGYKSGGRSKDLQKVKRFFDMEFTIIGAYQNKGKMENQCTLICETENGAEFGVKPKGSEAEREQYWADWQAGKLKGKKLTVQFFSWTTSDKPVPRFPVGVAVRDYEKMDNE